MSRPNVQAFHHAETGTWSYVVSDPAGDAAAIIDPVLDYDPKSGRTGTTAAAQLVAHVRGQGLRVEWILETHAHADHLSAAPWLQRQVGGRIAIGAGIREVQATFKPIFNLEQEFATDGSQFDHLFADGEAFALGAITARVIATPGHTNDSVSYLVGDALFTGDSLFMPDGGTARCDFPGGDAGKLFQSIQRLYLLPDDTRVFVCHDYAPGGRPVACETTIGEQKRSNIHVRSGVHEIDYVKTRRARDATLAMPVLMLPSVQVNIRAGQLPPAEDNGTRFLKIPLDKL
ncbi:MBL fold metallo-hydrolase [Arenimonas terrae]|uniref:MBL fold metallo-hydrolase n=1 Tax=Arenimonas terrae TaxID=2546226 RepID=A0A5C4RS44_9GAMM|nr:MBL fold metallo-hydrolase [Arenimonas terrae]TNJ33774.1 MBL fold metallo-hydrolase [Arenimonas terrae]